MGPHDRRWHHGPMVLRIAFLAAFAAACSTTETATATASANVTSSCEDLMSGASAEVPVAGVPWREQLMAYAEREVKHPAWGLPHSKRDYLLATRLAAREHLTVDDDVLFAAALLHDLGGLTAHESPGVDHAVRSAELAPEILRESGFPEAKIAAVQDVIRAHTYYNPVSPTTPEATVLRDADVLDFLGAIGFARLAATAGQDFPDLTISVKVSKSLRSELPAKLITPSAKCDGERRGAVLDAFHATLAAESFGSTHF